MLLTKQILFNRIKKFEIQSHQLNYLFWECTSRCNLSCLHCGSDCSKDSKHSDMPLEDFLAALDTIKNPSKNFMVVLTGGEPLLRKDVELCGKEIRKRGMRWSMVSNGHMYTAQKHNSLLNAGMGALTISLDGLEHSHNWMRNNVNSFKNVDAAIKLATSSNRLNFDVVTCVNQHNINELSEIRDYLISKNVKAWRLFTIVPIGRAKDYPELFLNPQQLKVVMEFIKASRKHLNMDVKFSCEGYVGKYENNVRDVGFFCRAGINIGSILIDGSISACPNIDRSFSQGNIYTHNFNDVWKNKYQSFRKRSWTKVGECADCSDYKTCQGNGMHYWHGEKSNVLYCHNNQLKKA